MAVQGDLNINSLNVRGLRNKLKRCTIFDWLKLKYKGIMFLQETHGSKEIEKEWENDWGGKILFNHGDKNSRGVAILFDKEHDYKILNTISDDEGRFLLLELSVDGQEFVLVNVYFPTSGYKVNQLKLIDFIAGKLNDYVDSKIILGGDFNVQLDTLSNGNKMSNSAVKSSLNNLVDNFLLVDVWRVAHPNKTQFTWRGKSHGKTATSRIDYFLISDELIQNLKSSNIFPSIKTDHSLIQFSINLPNTVKRGRGFWKFNCSLLTDKEYIAKINHYFDTGTIKYDNFENRSLVWDLIKFDIRNITLDYSIAKAKEKRARCDEIIKSLKNLETKVLKTEIELNEYEELKDEYERINENETKGRFIRSRSKWIEFGEKNSKFFFQLEKRNYNKKLITNLTVNENSITDPNEILKECNNFYKTLYTETSNDSVDDCPFFEIEHPKLTNEDKLNCDNILTLNEISHSVRELPNNKSPGTDGIPVDFYKFFWPKLNKFLFDSYMYSFNNSILSLDQRRAILNLIPKGNKDTRLLKNWRPISLLNSDYKIIAKVFAKRLQTVIFKIISNNQVGYIKGRLIDENIRIMLDILEISQNLEDPGMLVFVDFEKAFDTIRWKFMLKTLKLFNFGEYFQTWVKILYSDPLCCVSNNGNASDYFSPSRGIRQGCPLSALLFLLCVEFLALRITKDAAINGITLKRKEIKITQFADDTCLYLKNEASLKRAIELFECFYRYAGLKINLTKTEVMLLGRQTVNRDTIQSLNIINSPTKILGIKVCKDPRELAKINIDERIIKLKDSLKLWMPRYLTIKGKITIIKTIALPIFLFLIRLIHIPTDRIIEVQKILYNFVWPNGKYHVKHLTLIASIEDGGLKMPDVDELCKSMKITFLKTICKDTSNINATAKHILNKDDIIDLLKTKIDVKELELNSDYYKQLLTYWFNVHNTEPKTVTDILNENIWRNNFIKIGNKTVVKSEWEEKGIKKIANLLNENCTLKSIRELNQLFGIKQDVMFYNSLRSSIPKTWLKTIKNCLLSDYRLIDQGPSLLIKNKLLSLEKLTCRDIYWAEVNKKVVRPTAFNKWEAEFFYADFDWQVVCKIPYISSRETKLQSLQYQIVNRYFPCNYNLKLWKKRDDGLCQSCSEIDTIEHFFASCKVVEEFWLNLRSWLRDNFTVLINFGALDILFGVPNETMMNEITVLNFIILYGKEYIKTSRFAEKPLNILTFLKHLKCRVDIENQILIDLDQVDIYNLMWRDLHSALRDNII